MPEIAQSEAQLILEQYGETVHWYNDVSIQEGSLDEVLTWCKRNARGFWVWDMVLFPATGSSGLYRFFFDREDDFTVFLLTWT